MKVTNINGTTDNTCECGTWLEHWKRYNPARQSVPQYCPEKSCTNKAEVGAHVQKEGSLDRSWYIIPLCSRHNSMKGTTIEVSDFTSLASANVSQTCG